MWSWASSPSGQPAAPRAVSIFGNPWRLCLIAGIWHPRWKISLLGRHGNRQSHGEDLRCVAAWPSSDAP